MIDIQIANLTHLNSLQELFEQYREFYQMQRQETRSLEFLKQRLEKKDSIILLAFNQQSLAGFVQIYPAFTSVAMQPLWILNDLFVTQAQRKQGVARKLMESVESLARKEGIFSIKLATQINNAYAKKLYESLDYRLIDQFDHYSKKI